MLIESKSIFLFYFHCLRILRIFLFMVLNTPQWIHATARKITKCRIVMLTQERNIIMIMDLKWFTDSDISIDGFCQASILWNRFFFLFIVANWTLNGRPFLRAKIRDDLLFWSYNLKIEYSGMQNVISNQPSFFRLVLFWRGREIVCWTITNNVEIYSLPNVLQITYSSHKIRME